MTLVGINEVASRTGMYNDVFEAARGLKESYPQSIVKENGRAFIDLNALSGTELVAVKSTGIKVI